MSSVSSYRLCLVNLIDSEKEKHDSFVLEFEREKHKHFIYGLETALNLIDMYKDGDGF